MTPAVRCGHLPFIFCDQICGRSTDTAANTGLNVPVSKNCTSMSIFSFFFAPFMIKKRKILISRAAQCQKYRTRDMSVSLFSTSALKRDFSPSASSLRRERDAWHSGLATVAKAFHFSYISIMQRGGGASVAAGCSQRLRWCRQCGSNCAVGVSLAAAHM